MPQNTTIDVGSAWEMLTDANVTEIPFQNLGEHAVYVTATNGPASPSDSALGLRYGAGQGECRRPLADLFPGVSGANRVWARAGVGTQAVFVSHA